MTAADRVRALSAMLEGTSIGLLELTTLEETILLRRDGADVPKPLPQAAAEPLTARIPSPGLVAAPCPGVFCTMHPTQDGPLAQVGRRVAAGEAVGLVQVGRLLVHVVAPTGGVVDEILSVDGAVVGYGTPLLRMRRRADELD